MNLNGTAAIVTGGSGALGGRISHKLAEAGANVAAVYNQGREQAEALVAELRASGVDADTFQCDVTDPTQVEKMVSAAAQRFGKVDILVNDAAYNKWIPFADLDAMTYDDWDKIMSVNLNGPMYCIKAVAGLMRGRGSGRIVNISSVAGMGPTGSSIPYAVSKAALNHLTKCMAVALAPEVLVNCVAPGFLKGTRMSANLAPEYQERAKAGSLLKRAADKDDVAAQVVEFCRTDSITGQTLVVDSGRVFH